MSDLTGAISEKVGGSVANDVEDENTIATVLDAAPKEIITIDNPYSNFTGEF